MAVNTGKTKLTVRPLTPETWGDFTAIFNSKGCSVARGCWCMCYRESGKVPKPPPGMTVRDVRKRQMKQLARGPVTPGLIGYFGDEPVGWMSLGPREAYARLQRSSVMKPLDDTPVWSIICFVIPRHRRGQGIGKALLKAAIQFARAKKVKVLEGYPVDKKGRVKDEYLWFGTPSMFTRAGFKEVARRKPERPIMRLNLSR